MHLNDCRCYVFTLSFLLLKLGIYQTTNSLSSPISLDNSFCTDEYFQKEWLTPTTTTTTTKAITSTMDQVKLLQDAGWSSLANKPTSEWGVCPCHNAAFTADSEQWDGIPRNGLNEIRFECYFSLPKCSKYFKNGNCPGANPPPTPPRTPPPPSSSSPPLSTSKKLAKILVATVTPYTIHQLSNKQAGKCSKKCDFQNPIPGQPIILSEYDGVVWPLDWSFGTGNTLPVPDVPSSTISNEQRLRQLWIGFTEEDMFKTIGGRPDLWSNKTFLKKFDLLSSYDYGSSDLPFNLWKLHFFRSCTINAYFAPPPNHFNNDPFIIKKVPLVSYVSRNCRKQRDDWVRKLSNFIPIASIGKCLHNYDWPFPKRSYPYWLEKILAIRHFPFVLAIEGSDEPGKSGLISEKLFDAFAAGSVPIYWGAPRHTVERLAPSPESFIHVDDFNGSVELLSHHLIYLSNNPNEYNKYHEWRNSGPNEKFCQLLETNINTLACRICESVSKHVLKIENKSTTKNEDEKKKTQRGSQEESQENIYKWNNREDGGGVIAFVIKSKKEHNELRQIIRKTWGNIKKQNATILFHFLITASSMTSKLELELQKYGDIIITSRLYGEAILDYSNVLIETTNAMNQQLYYLIISHDDIYINMNKMIRLLQKRRTKVYMGQVEEYEQDGQPIDVNSPLYASSSLDSNGGKTDLLQYPVHANSKNMYLLSGDIIHFLSDNVNDLTNIQWMNNDDQSIDVEGPIIASWLVLIQAHAERGCSDCNISWVKPIKSNLEMINNHSLSISSVTIETLINWKIQQ